MCTKFNNDLFRLCHPAGQLRELNRRADLGAIEEKMADAFARVGSEIDRLRYELTRTNNPIERDTSCYTDLAYVCLRLTEDDSPALDDGGKE